MLQKQATRLARQKRVRAKISGTAARPRLNVFRSNANIYAQLIDDEAGTTLVAVSDIKETSGTKMERAQKVGAEIAEKAKSLKIKEVVFDRGGFLYHGRVKALDDSARGAGLTF